MKPMIYKNILEKTDDELLDKGIYRGYEYEILSYGTHPCAYVTLPAEHPCVDKDYDDIYVHVHGGLTYKHGHVVGWDYAHAGDKYGEDMFGCDGHAWTTEEILEDVHTCIDQLIEMKAPEKPAEETQQAGRTALLIKATGEARFITPKNGTYFTLKELYQLLGCDMVEVVYPVYESDCIFIIDEEGKLTGKDVNYAATIMWGGHPSDVLVGDVIFCHTSMLK
jgi:hypothetical protein